MKVKWLMTNPHPTRPAHTHSADDGRVGWRHHAVPEEGFYKRAKALCGLRPRHGWGNDLFADEMCERCYQLALKQGIALGEGLQRSCVHQYRELKTLGKITS